MQSVEKDKTTYRMQSGNYKSEEGGTYTGYGVDCLGLDGTVLCRAEDLSTDHGCVHELAELLNEHGAEVTHFYEIVDDFLVTVT